MQRFVFFHNLHSPAIFISPNTHTHTRPGVSRCIFQPTHTALKPCLFLSHHGTGLVIKLSGEPTRSHSSHPLFPLMSKVSRGSRVQDSMGAHTHTHTRKEE